MYASPLQVIRGDRQWVYDEKGRRYLDAFAGVATVSIGHSHPHWVKKINEQVSTLFHTTTLYLHPSMGQYAKRLIEKVRPANPELDVCYFANSGSEANEMATMLAKTYTASHELIAQRHSYHGRTQMAVALTGQSGWRNTGPYASGVYHTPVNYTYRRPAGMTPAQFAQHCAAELEELIRTSTGGRIAAFIAEPMTGVGGVIVPEPSYFPEAYRIVKKYGGLFIADEVQTGLGRTGEHFLGIQNWGVKPDIVTMAKGIGNGYPISAVITTREIAESVKGKLHFNTFGGSPVAMAAAGAVMDVFDKESLQENTKEVGTHLLSLLGKLAEREPLIGDVRGKGLMIGVELVKSKKTKEPAPDAALKVLDLCKDRGVLVGKGGMNNNVIRIKPPLCFSRKDAEAVAGALGESLKALRG